MMASQEIDAKLSDDSESVTSGSSYYSSSSMLDAPWLTHVRSDGSLFYFYYDDIDLDYVSEHSVEHVPAQASSQPLQSKPKKSAAGKIKKWMKDRGKKVKKFIPLFRTSRNETLSSLSMYNSKDIIIEVEAESLKSVSDRSSVSEILLGLKLGSLNDDYQLWDKVHVLGILAGQNVPDVKIGDWVKSINDVDVNIGTFENVLRELKLPSKVKLGIMVLQDERKPQFVRHRHENLIKELDGDPETLEAIILQFQHVPHGLFYFSIEKGTIENDDVLFRYPGEDTPLFQLKGMFLTLGLMIDDVATPPLSSCTVLVQEQIVHVGYAKDGDGVMVLAFPGSVVSAAEVQQFATGLAKLFKYQFFSLKQTFLTGNEDKYLHNFLISFFKHYLSPLQWENRTVSEPYLLDILPSAQWLPLQSDLKTEIDNTLTELESADFGNDSEGFYNNARIYNIHSSCFFYKGYLISSTLRKDDLLDIHLFLHYNHILELTKMQPISKIIIWKEVFPTRQKEQSSDADFEEVDGRWFMNIVVMGHCILAALLVDGGSALKAEDYPAPEPFYVQEITNTLLVMEAGGQLDAIEEKIELESGMITQEMFTDNSCRTSLSSAFASNVSISSSGPFSSTHSASHSSLGVAKEGAKASSDKSEVKRQQLLSSIGPADGESDSSSKEANLSVSMKITPIRFRSNSESTKSIDSSECSETSKDTKDETSRNFSSSLPNLNVPTHSSDNTYFQNSLKMVSGFGDNLFYYLHMDPVEGIYIAPLVSDFSLPGTIEDKILINFHQTCMNMRRIFEHSLRSEQIANANIQTKYGVDSFPQHADEQGFSFKLHKPDSTKKKGSRQEPTFWVIGRLFFAPEPREVYVCYCDNSPKDVVEMAFRLGFGLSF